MEYIIKTVEKKRYISFPKLTELGLNNAFSTSDMDFRLRENPNTEKIAHDYALLKSQLNAQNKIMFSSNQVHDCNIISVNSANQGESYEYGKTLPPVDGLITNKPEFVLKTTYADCTPLLIFDPVAKCQASLHSGWKGTTKQIGYLGVKRLEEEYKAKAENMVAVIGPAIGETSFEVEEDVVNIFKETFDFWEEVIKLKQAATPKSKAKYLIDIKQTNKRILVKAGLKEENIIICPLDTFNNELFHSHRFDGEQKAGRMVMLSVIH